MKIFDEDSREFPIAKKIEELVDKGLSEKEAERQVMRAFWIALDKLRDRTYH